MQLLLILLLLLGGKGIPQEMLPLMEELGGESLKKSFQEAEGLADVLQCALAMAPRQNASCATQQKNEQPQGVGFPLSAVVNIADNEVISAFYGYFQTKDVRNEQIL